jgi:N12 class adenine-specific DNA methylase
MHVDDLVRFLQMTHYAPRSAEYEMFAELLTRAQILDYISTKLISKPASSVAANPQSCDLSKSIRGLCLIYSAEPHITSLLFVILHFSC